MHENCKNEASPFGAYVALMNQHDTLIQLSYTIQLSLESTEKLLKNMRIIYGIEEHNEQ